MRFIVILAGLCWLCLTMPCRAERVLVEYWDKWTGAEGASMEAIVEAFNASQDRITVRYSAISQIDLKLMLSVAGRHPPDVAGLWTHTLPVYVENNALHPLDGLATSGGIQGEDYLPSIWSLCRYRDRLWALPATPSSLALHWNKRLFREAGLNPEHPPTSIAELEEMNIRLRKTDAQGHVTQFGHLPEEPGWWRSMWGYWFDGVLWDGKSQITANAAGNVRALAWVRSYPERFGTRESSAFIEGFGNFASPLNPFIQGKVAMELQGPWMWNFINKYGDGEFELGVAPFPSAMGASAAPVTIVESDILVIPAGAAHVAEAFEFMCFVNRPDMLEQLCAAQCKFTPLLKVSDNFWANHPHPYIRVFYDLARSPNARSAPQIPNWNQLKAEMDHAVKEVWSLREPPESALADVQKRMQKDLGRRIERWNRLDVRLNAEWSEREGQP